MPSKRSAAFVCCVVGMLFLVGGVLCLFAPMIGQHGTKKPLDSTAGIFEAVAGMGFCFLSIVWFVIARFMYNSALREEQNGEREFLLSV